MKTLSLIAFLAGALGSGPALADQVGLAFGGDTYAAGQTAAISDAVAHDAFLAGYSVTLSAPVNGNAHLAGYSVSSGAAVQGDVYAAGYSVAIDGTVGGDITAIGNTLLLRPTAPIPGNVRVAGAIVNLESAIQGSLLATAQTLTLNAPVTGDFSFYGETLTFGPAARVDGKVSIQAPKEIAVPASVASADRVSFQLLTSPDYASEAGKTAENIVKGFWFTVWAAAMWWLLLFVVGAACIALAPALVTQLQIVSATRPFRRLGLGVLTFASVVGLVPVAVMTLVGVLLVPFVLIFVVAACSLAYLAGVYFIGLRIATAVTPIETNGRRMVVLALSLVVGGLLTMVPFLGWFVTLVLLAFGFGIMAALTMASWSAGDSARLSGAAPAGATGHVSV